MMVKKVILLFIVVICSFAANAQEENTHIITQEENTNWINNFSKLSLSEQVNWLRQRMEDDQTVYLTARAPHSNQIEHLKEGYTAKTYYRPIYIFRGAGNYEFLMNGNPDVRLTNAVVDVLEIAHVAGIQLLKGSDSKTTAIYGQRGASGVIIITLNNNQDLEKLKSANH